MEKECKKIGFMPTKYDLKYVGECLDGKPNGFGIYYLLNKLIYEGGWFSKWVWHPLL